ncbi:gp098 [Rhodococcus phage ReqiPepy6]|uniref:Gp098 n=1 Tax=Rhodococcus phage ReqiPepy6 TaxID=691965 RepID=D4P7K9_9CAUD|nr:gp098 [Rhodococcus phage ReqiPepy6]ADD80989.1 gp098 [Rhodococcus phage ReqiPepy6]
MTDMNFVSTELGRTLDHMRSTLLHELYGAAGTDEPWASEPATVILQKYLSFRNAERDSLKDQVDRLTQEKTEAVGKLAAASISNHSKDEIVEGALDEMLDILQIEWEIQSSANAKLELVVDHLRRQSGKETLASGWLDSLLDILDIDTSEIEQDAPPKVKGRAIYLAVEKLKEGRNAEDLGDVEDGSKDLEDRESGAEKSESVETVEGVLDLLLHTLNVDTTDISTIDSKRDKIVKTIRAMRANEAAMSEELFDLNRIAAIKDLHTYFDGLIQALQIEGDIYPSVEKKKHAIRERAFQLLGDLKDHEGIVNDIVVSVYGKENDIPEDFTTSQKLMKIQSDFRQGSKRVLNRGDIQKIHNSLKSMLHRAGGDISNIKGDLVDLAAYTERFVFNTLIHGDAGDAGEISVFPIEVMRMIHNSLEEIIRQHGEDTHPDETTAHIAERALTLVLSKQASL